MRTENLSAEIAAELRGLIATGSLRSGERINETALSERLEVSRTPLREALSRLASEGFVTSRARRGFFVQELRPDEVEELYRIRAILDPAALELAGLPPAEQLSELRALNRAIAESGGDPERTVSLDERWHRRLLAHCPNRILLDLIGQFMLRTRPLELLYMARHPNVEATAREHRRILDRLEAGDLEGAVSGLRQNMTTAIPVLTEWVRRQSRTEGGRGG